jgi:Nif-specific regulatory protein
VVPLMLPPLRDRPGDIPLLANEFLKRFNSENGRTLVFGQGAMDVLTACYFPGNVRELENCVRRTATLAPNMAIIGDDFACRHDQCLSSMLWKGHSGLSPQRPKPELPLPVAPAVADINAGKTNARLTPSEPFAASEAMPVGASTPTAIAVPEHDHLVEAMERAGWVQAKAARILGLTPRQIGYALKKHNIEIKRF